MKLKKILNTIDSISEWTGRIFCWTVCVIIILVVIEVILRRFFGRPTTWSFETVIQVYAFHFMIVAAYTLLHQSHVFVDILYSRVSKRTQAVLDVIGYSIFFFPFMSVLLFEGIKFAANSWSVRETSWSVFAPPLYPIKTVIPLMAFLVLIQGIAIFIRQLYMAVKGKEL